MKFNTGDLKYKHFLWSFITGILAIWGLLFVFQNSGQMMEQPDQGGVEPISVSPAALSSIYPGEIGTDVSAQINPTDSFTTWLPLAAKNYLATAPLWRFGVGKARLPLTAYATNDMVGLRLGWYVDWAVTADAPRPYGIEYVPLVSVKQWKLDGSNWTTWCVGCPYVQPYTYTVSPSRETIRAVALAQPGMMWLIGNEIERVDWNGGRQDEILPELYAQAYHELYHLIKEADPTAQIAIGGVIQATPLRLQYLDRVWSAYQVKYSTIIPVDVWNVHAFVLREERGSWGADIPAGINVDKGQLYSENDNKNFTIAWNHIRAMRQWMKDKGQQNKPLIISEYGVNMPPWMDGFSYEQVRDSFMYPSFNYFLNQTDTALGYPADGYRLVQRWNWYSLDDDAGRYDGGSYEQFFNGNLFYSGLGDKPKGLSPLGVYWTNYVKSLPADTVKPYQQASFSSVQPSLQAVQSAITVEQDCDGRQIRLIFVEPAPPGASAGLDSKTAPKVQREELFCLPKSQ